MFLIFSNIFIDLYRTRINVKKDEAMAISIKRAHYTKSEQAFLFIWTIFSISSAIEASRWGMGYYGMAILLSNICRYTILLLQFVFLVNMFMTQKWKPRKILQYILVIALVIVVEINIMERTLLILTFFILLGQMIDLDKLLRYDIKLKIVMLFLILGLCALGVLENRANDFQSGYKMSLGFNHPNLLTCYVITILIEWLCIRYKKMRWLDWVGLIVILAVVVLVSNARTSVFTFLIVLSLYFLANYYPKIFELKLFQSVLIVVTPLMAFISFYLIKLYSVGNEIVIAINAIMSGRVALWYEALAMKGVKLFGQNIIFSSRLTSYDQFSTFLIDNAYMRMFLRWGSIIACGIIIMYMFQFVKLMKIKRIDFLLMSLFFVIYGFGESYMMSVFYNISLLCLLSVTNEN